jgi:hypothetical protein
MTSNSKGFSSKGPGSNWSGSRWTHSRWTSEENLFRLGAFFLAVILWMSLMDRKEFQITHHFTLEFILPHGTVVSFQSADSVRVKFSGGRQIVRNWVDGERGQNSIFLIDLRGKETGEHELSLVSLMKQKYSQLNLVSVEPAELRLRLIQLGAQQKNNLGVQEKKNE